MNHLISETILISDECLLRDEVIESLLEFSSAMQEIGSELVELGHLIAIKRLVLLIRFASDRLEIVLKEDVKDMDGAEILAGQGEGDDVSKPACFLVGLLFKQSLSGQCQLFEVTALNFECWQVSEDLIVVRLAFERVSISFTGLHEISFNSVKETKHVPANAAPNIQGETLFDECKCFISAVRINVHEGQTFHR